MADRRAFLKDGASLVATAALAPRTMRLPQAGATETLRIQRLSWAGIKIELGQRTLLVDAWVSPAIWDGAWTAPVVPVDVGTSSCSAAITHLHNDHFDPALLREKLGTTGEVICGGDIGTLVASRGFRARPVDLYQPYAFGGMTITPVPAVDGVGASQVSWIVAGGGRKIIHCGDGVWHGTLWRIGRQHGPFDAVFVPINGADLLGTDPPAGVPLSATPEQAAAMALVLGARLAVPIHYGVNDPHAYIEFPDALRGFREAASRRNIKVRVLEPGEWLDW